MSAGVSSCAGTPLWNVDASTPNKTPGTGETSSSHCVATADAAAATGPTALSLPAVVCTPACAAEATAGAAVAALAVDAGADVECDAVGSCGVGGAELGHELGELMSHLWRDPATQLAYRLANRYQLYDSAAYYLNTLDRLAAPGTHMR